MRELAADAFTLPKISQEPGSLSSCKVTKRTGEGRRPYHAVKGNVDQHRSAYVETCVYN